MNGELAGSMTRGFYVLRVSGGGRAMRPATCRRNQCSPHERGWAERSPLRLGGGRVFPASAGVVGENRGGLYPMRSVPVTEVNDWMARIASSAICTPCLRGGERVLLEP